MIFFVLLYEVILQCVSSCYDPMQILMCVFRPGGKQLHSIL